MPTTDRMKRSLKRIEEANATAKARKLKAKNSFDEWRKNKSVELMVPYVQEGNTDSRPVVDKGPPIRRAYLHTYGWTRAERRVAQSALNRNQRRKTRAGMKILFHQIWESERARNEAA